MKIYRVSMSGDFGGADSSAAWTGRKADIPRLKRELRDACFDRDAQPEPTVEEVEFLPTRSGIIEMLNRYADR